MSINSYSKLGVILAITIGVQFLAHGNWSAGKGQRTSFEGKDTIQWSSGYRLSYDDFKGPSRPENKGSGNDTMAICAFTIKYKLKVVDRFYLKIEAFAVFERNNSWMRVKTPFVLGHEQGHFDIAEIYALRFEKIVNDTTIKDPHDFFEFLNETFKQIAVECNDEEGKYDIISKNTLGREQYSKWISEQLDSLAKGR